MGVDLYAHPACLTRIAPHHRIVTDNTSRRMIERGENRITGRGRRIDGRHEPLDFVGVDHPAVDAKRLVGFRPDPQPIHGGVRMRERQMALL